MPNTASYAEDHRGRSVTAAASATSTDRQAPSRAPAYVGTPRLTRYRPHARQPTRQPWEGLAGLFVIIPVAVILAVALGSLEDSALVLGPLTTFALPAIATIAFWWEDWPGASLRAGWAGLTDTLLVAAAGVVLTALGQSVVNGLDLRGVFLADPGPGHPLTYPATMALAGGAFTAMLQLTLVTEGWPLRGRAHVDRLWAGLIALVLSWVLALAAWLLVIDPGPLGHVGRETFGIWLIVLGAWQVVFYVVLHGRPFTHIKNDATRLISGNAALLALAAVTYAVLRGGGVEDGVIGAASGTVVGAGLVVAMLFDGWPGTRFTGVVADVVVVVTVAVLAALLYAVLSVFSSRADLHRVSETSWITLAALNFVGMVVILHVSVWRRWPVIARPVPSGNETAPARGAGPGNQEGVANAE
jgi:hypothetical protein